MSKFTSPPNNLHIASPCPADWNQMFGDERKRFCADCKLNVYNLSGMSRDEAESLISNAEARVCVRYFKRADGTVITQDCPVGWARIKQRTRAAFTAAASLVIALFSGVLIVSLFPRTRAEGIGELRIPTTTTLEPIATIGMISVGPHEPEPSPKPAFEIRVNKTPRTKLDPAIEKAMRSSGQLVDVN